VFDGACQQVAAEASGMDRQTLRNWMIRLKEKGPDGFRQTQVRRHTRKDFLARKSSNH
jgi:transposase-like protein